VLVEPIAVVPALPDDPVVALSSEPFPEHAMRSAHENVPTRHIRSRRVAVPAERVKERVRSSP
jgi:hypothetical protein